MLLEYLNNNYKKPRLNRGFLLQFLLLGYA